MVHSAHGDSASTPVPLAAAEAARRVKITGHRGARGIAPENTLAGFQVALDLGVDMFELDVHLSRDGELVVMHDPQVARTTDGTGTIRDHSLAELRRLNAAARFEGSRDYGVQRVPTLQEVFDLVQGRCRIDCEIKLAADGTRYPGIESQIVELVRRNDAVDKAVISSFDFATLARVGELEPRLTRYGIVAQAYFDGLSARHQGLQDAVDEFRARGLACMAVHHSCLTADLCDRLHQAGLRAHAWVIDDLAGLIRFAALGVEEITSDRPDVLLEARR